MKNLNQEGSREHPGRVRNHDGSADPAPARARLGCLPRPRISGVPHYSALAATRSLADPPVSIDYSDLIRTTFGTMLNGRLNDCTCAAYYHAVQIWSAHSADGLMTMTDDIVEKLYHEACGYVPNPNDPTYEGPLASIQGVLTFLQETGAPMPDGSRRRIAAFAEVDGRMSSDLKQALIECGAVIAGFAIPSCLDIFMPTWDYDGRGDRGESKGHAVILVGYDGDGVIAISCGRKCTLTWRFVIACAREIYAIADAGWMESSGESLAGLPPHALVELMASFRATTAQRAAPTHGPPGCIPHPLTTKKERPMSNHTQAAHSSREERLHVYRTTRDAIAQHPDSKKYFGSAIGCTACQIGLHAALAAPLAAVAVLAAPEAGIIAAAVGFVSGMGVSTAAATGIVAALVGGGMTGVEVAITAICVQLNACDP